MSGRNSDSSTRNPNNRARSCDDRIRRTAHQDIETGAVLQSVQSNRLIGRNIPLLGERLLRRSCRQISTLQKPRPAQLPRRILIAKRLFYSEFRDSPSRAARSASFGSRSPGPSSPETIIPLILTIASSVNAI